MVHHFKNYFKWVKKKFLNKKSKIIEIGSNDGSFLKNFKKHNFEHLGFEPSKNIVDYSKKHNQVNVFNGFFNINNVKKFKQYKSKTDLVCAANVICHIPNRVSPDGTILAPLPKRLVRRSGTRPELTSRKEILC